MKRETTKFKTPGDVKVEIYTYLTGGESEKIQDAIIGDVEMDVTGDMGGAIKGKSIRKAQDKTLELMLVSIDGKKEELLKRAKDLKQQDYQFIVEKINEITKNENPIKKKKENK
jgi:hypothetical protein